VKLENLSNSSGCFALNNQKNAQQKQSPNYTVVMRKALIGMAWYVNLYKKHYLCKTKSGGQHGLIAPL
jgi:hypothetical protein